MRFYRLFAKKQLGRLVFLKCLVKILMLSRVLIM